MNSNGITESMVAAAFDHRPITEELPRLIAIHEAGHAIVAHRLGWRVHQLTAVPHDGINGCCTVTPRWMGRPRTRETQTRQSITIALAGPIATLIASRSFYGSAFDIRMARQLVDTVRRRDESRITFLARAWAHAERILNGRWQAVETLADLLIEHGELDGSELILSGTPRRR